MTSSSERDTQRIDLWPLRQLLTVRTVVIFLLVQAPFLLFIVPFGSTISEWMHDLFDAPIIWFGESVLGFDEVVRRGPGGSGDSALDWSRTALSASVAVLGAIIWTLAKPNRQSQKKLLAWIYVGLRYGLGVTLFQYGIFKVLPSQFPEPQGDMLLLPFGDSSPMGLLWRYMGFSHAFNIVTGGVEVVAGLLLLFRRTWLVGALLSVIAMTQVVVLNFTFDVPVKIFSSELLVASLVLLIPFRHRLITALFSDKPVPVRQTDPVVLPVKLNGLKNPLKAVLLVACLGFMVDGAWHYYNEVGRGASFELAGIYDVESITTTSASAQPTVVSINHLQGMSLWHEVGERSTWQGYFVELADDELTLSDFGDRDGQSGQRGQLTVTRLSDSRLTVTGRIGTTDISMELRKRPPPELLSRGFHWVSEYPTTARPYRIVGSTTRRHSFVTLSAPFCPSASTTRQWAHTPNHYPQTNTRHATIITALSTLPRFVRAWLSRGIADDASTLVGFSSGGVSERVEFLARVLKVERPKDPEDDCLVILASPLFVASLGPSST